MVSQGAMKTFSAEYLKKVATSIFVGLGSPKREASVVSEELVEASLMGLDSHGIIRCIWYFDECRAGRIKPGAAMRVLKETTTTAVVDVNLNFGQVGARKMVEIAVAKAKASGLSCVISRHCHHVGRLGSYTQAIASRDLIGLGFTCSHKAGHYVVPWGGREARLATNPISYAVPTGGNPVVLDMSTSMISEGKIRVLMHEDKTIPPGCVLNAQGYATTDPREFYGPPRGTILPFGGEMGYKGFGLGLMSMALGEAMAGEDITDEYHYLNGLALIAVNPGVFGPLDEFKKRMGTMVQYMKNTQPAPGFKAVLMPGELDFRTKEKRLRNGIPLAERTWEELKGIAAELNITLDAV